MYTIGLDIGGTHTDGVLLDRQEKKVAYGKTITTTPLHEGVITMINQLIKKSEIDPQLIANVVMGTTHATNAILEGKKLLKVGVLRLMIGKPRFPSPGFNWPFDLKSRVIGAFETCEGGYECDGRASLLCLKEVKDAIQRLLKSGVEAISVIGTFSPLNGEQELKAEKMIQEIVGKNFPVSLSHQIGGIGIIERENATILNSALKKVIFDGFMSMEHALKQLGIQAPLWLTENNGSLLSLEEAIHFPIKTIGAGPTNSFIGASKICGIQDAIVVDMGGTSTDIGIVEGGYARSSLQAANIGGISLHFSMPDMISLAIGGGSHVYVQEESLFKIGPQSVARDLNSLSQVFGGRVLTLTDAGVVAGLLEIREGNGENIDLNCDQAKKILKAACQQIYQAIVRLRGKRDDLPVILVGGGAPLMKHLIHDFELKGWMPHEFAVANAYGAGLAEVSSIVDKVVTLKERESMLNELKTQAIQQTIVKGGNEKQVRIASISILPFAYTREALAKVVITASGPRSQK